MNLSYASVETPVPGSPWTNASDESRLALVETTLRELSHTGVTPVSATANGQVFVNLTDPLPAARRGPLLLEIERCLKQTIDPALVLWLEPMGDRNSLRNLRGIEVKK